MQIGYDEARTIGCQSLLHVEHRIVRYARKNEKNPNFYKFLLLKSKFQIRLAVFTKSGTTYRPTIIDSSIDYCSFMENSISSSLLDAYLNVVRNFTTNVHKCPFKVISFLLIKCDC